MGYTAEWENRCEYDNRVEIDLNLRDADGNVRRERSFKFRLIPQKSDLAETVAAVIDGVTLGIEPKPIEEPPKPVDNGNLFASAKEIDEKFLAQKAATIIAELEVVEQIAADKAAFIAANSDLKLASNASDIDILASRTPQLTKAQIVALNDERQKLLDSQLLSDIAAMVFD